MDNYEDINDIPEEVVEPQETIESEVEEISEKNEEVAETQTEEQNRIYKNMRLKAETEAKQSLEKERSELEKLRLETQQALAERKIVDEFSDPKRVEELADKRGITDDLARELLRLQANEAIQSEKLKVTEAFNNVQKKKMELRLKYPQYQSVESEIEAVLLKHPNATDVDYENLFFHTVGKNLLSLNKDVAKATEKQVVANMHDKARRKNVGNGTSSNGDIIASTVLTPEGMAMSNAFGNDPREIAKYIKKIK
jgi:hypothetical protein